MPGPAGEYFAHHLGPPAWTLTCWPHRGDEIFIPAQTAHVSHFLLPALKSYSKYSQEGKSFLFLVPGNPKQPTISLQHSPTARIHGCPCVELVCTPLLLL